jgi:hypothetical protein
MDKGVWRTLIEDDYRVPQQSSPSALLTASLTNLGSSDAELREDACAILGQWIEVQSLYSPQELRLISAQLWSNLRQGLGEQETDTVFLHSFSLLVLTNVLD